MAVVLGKRKRRADLGASKHEVRGSQANERLQALLRRHFETSYEPLNLALPAPPEAEAASDAMEDENSEDGWEGLSDKEESEVIEVVHHDYASGVREEDSLKQEWKAFMSNKPPSAPSGNSPKDKENTKSSAAEDATEATHLKNDVALQRLLQESALLHASQTALGTMPSSAHPTASSFTHIGKARHKALDLRMQSLGAEGSLFEQKKRPFNHRLGMVEKRRSKEQTRRTEAKLNGIILEKELKKDRKNGVGKDRGKVVGAASVGRMKGGTLVLSGRDVKEIQGPSKASSSKKKGRR